MSKRHILTAGIILVLAALAVSSFSVFAQDTDDTPPPFGYGYTNSTVSVVA